MEEILQETLENFQKQIASLENKIDALTKTKEVLTKKEAAEFLNISERTLSNLTNEGKIRHKKVGNGKKNDHLRYRREWLINWMEKGDLM